MATFQVGATLITFGLLLEGSGFSRQAAVSVEHIPGGNVNYIDLGGLEEPIFPCRGLLASFADLVSMMGIAGLSGTLIYSEATYTAVLRSCKRSKALGNTAGTQFADLEFVLVL